MPTLLQINECLNFSTGAITQSIGEQAILQGWKSYIAYSGREKTISSKSKLIRVGSTFDSCIHYIRQRIFDNEGLCSQAETRKLIRKIECIQPDIVHLHNIHDHWLNYQILFEYLNSTDIQVVWTFHDCWAFTGHCFHFVTKQCNRWETGCFDCPLKHIYPNTLLDRSRENYAKKKQLFASSKNLTIVACSDWMKNFVKRSFLKDKNVVTIHNGIDLARFGLQKHTKSTNVFRLLAVSNVWNQEKGLYDIFKLRELLSDEYEITIVGLTDKQIKSLPCNIRGIKRTQNIRQLVELYTSSNAFINPTYADTFPTVNLEALACGTPVITYNTGGSPEAIDEKTGIVVEQGNVNKLAEAIKTLRYEPLRSVDCRKKTETEFDKNNQFQKYIILYNEILNK